MVFSRDQKTKLNVEQWSRAGYLGQLNSHEFNAAPVFVLMWQDSINLFEHSLLLLLFMSTSAYKSCIPASDYRLEWLQLQLLENQTQSYVYINYLFVFKCSLLLMNSKHEHVSWVIVLCNCSLKQVQEQIGILLFFCFFQNWKNSKQQ